MITSLLVLASMLIFSDRENFWDSETVAAKTQVARVDDEGTTRVLNKFELEKAIGAMAGKRVLVLVHGLDTDEPYEMYSTIAAEVAKWEASSQYDHVIGYVWPSYANFWDYYEAEENVDAVIPRFRDVLKRLQRATPHVDVMAHSLGNRLVLASLNDDRAPQQGKLVKNFFSVAPAVNDVIIEENEAFAPAMKNCHNMYIFFSSNDDVLKWFYPIPEWHENLGFEEDVFPDETLGNAQMVDCSAVIDAHDAYLTSSSIFKYMEQVIGDPCMAPYYAQDVSLLTDGHFQVKRWRHAAMSLSAHVQK